MNNMEKRMNILRTNAHRIATVAGPLLAAVTATRADTQALPKHHEWNATPIAQKVTIDGDLSDWDRSAGIYVNSPAAREEFARTGVWAYAMYDKENLYLGFRVYDATPMNNHVD